MATTSEPFASQMYGRRPQTGLSMAKNSNLVGPQPSTSAPSPVRVRYCPQRGSTGGD